MAVGSTLEEAFYYIHNLVTACEIQVSHPELHVGINDILCVYLSVCVLGGGRRWDLFSSFFFLQVLHIFMFISSFVYVVLVHPYF